MRIAILSRNKGLHSIRRLLQEAQRIGVRCDVINPLECQLIIDGKNSRILAGNTPLQGYDIVLPRIGASITDYGLAVVRQFESLGMKSINSAQAIANSRDKLRCLQILSQAGLHVPATALSRSARSVRSAVQAVRGIPVVLKLLQGTQGVGVMLVHSHVSLASVLDTLHGLNQEVLIQEFINAGSRGAEAKHRDYRAFVVGDKVVAAMMRSAPQGEFRSNIHRGGQGQLVALPKSYERAPTRAAQLMGLRIAGVDLMEGPHGPLILEVNSSPGFEGIEQATGLNIAAMMMKELVLAARKETKRKKASKKRRSAKRRTKVAKRKRA